MNENIHFITTEELHINLITQQVNKNDRVLKLPHLSYLTLTTLIKHAPNIVSVDYLIDQIWQDVNVSPETLTQRIALLRKSLGQSKHSKHQYIESIRNKGYRWLPSVHTAKDNIAVKKAYSKPLIIFIIFCSIIAMLAFWYYLNKEPHCPIINSTSIDRQVTEKDLTQQAWRYLNKHDLTSNQLATGLFEKSLQANPNQVEALAGLSIALSHQVTKFNQPIVLLKKAENLAQQAIGISPEYAITWKALAFMHDAKGETNKAITFYEKALTIKPDHASTISSLAYLYSLKGRLTEALQLNLSVLGQPQHYLDLQIAQTLELLSFDSIAEQWYQKADELSPDNVFATYERSRFYINNNQLKKATDLINQAIERGVKQPELFITLGIIDLINQNKVSARTNFQKAINTNESNNTAHLWHFIAMPEAQLSEQKILDFENNWLSDSLDSPGLSLNKAIFAAYIGKKAEAIQWLNQAHASGYLNHKWLNKLPVFITLQREPKFHQIIEGMKNDIDKQKQQVLNADWLPTSFLDPKQQ